MSSAILMLMLGAVLTFGVALVWAIGENLRRGDKLRRRMAGRLGSLRLGRTLTTLGVDAKHYLHSQRVADIEAQIRNCSTCSEMARCDDSLEKGAVEALDFCPNRDALDALRDRALLQQAQ